MIVQCTSIKKSILFDSVYLFVIAVHRHSVITDHKPNQTPICAVSTDRLQCALLAPVRDRLHLLPMRAHVNGESKNVNT